MVRSGRWSVIRKASPGQAPERLFAQKLPRKRDAAWFRYIVPRGPGVTGPTLAMNEDLPNEAAPEAVPDAPGDVSEVSGLLSAEHPKRRTLPPPEWMGSEGPRSAASIALERYELDMPVPHRMGPRAELASLGARLAAASAAGDGERERVAATSLARAGSSWHRARVSHALRATRAAVE